MSVVVIVGEVGIIVVMTSFTTRHGGHFVPMLIVITGVLIVAVDLFR
jgi:hypothetical protein